MMRKTVTLTRGEGEILSRLVKATKSDASKVMRLALRSLYERERSKSMEEAYQRFYAAGDAEGDAAAADFTAAGAPLW